MAKSKDKKKDKKQTGGKQIIVQNKKVRHEYHIHEEYETGIMLSGSEVKSLRQGLCSIGESYAKDEGGEIYLLNLYIGEYSHVGPRFQHKTHRPRKLLLHKREINKIIGSIMKKGMTIVPLSLYFNPDGRVKVALGLATGKKLHDKRQDAKDRDWNRDKQRLLRGRGDI